MSSHPSRTRGFTLAEIMIVVVIIGLLAAMAMVALNHARERAQATRITSDLRQFRDAFTAYVMVEQAWPAAAAAGVIPTGMDGYLSLAYLNTAEPGGAYSWTGSAGQIRFATLSASAGTMAMVDAAIDDGNLATGAFTQVGGSLYQLQL